MLPENAKQPESPTKDKKSRMRSPNYPAIGLEEAVRKIEALYKQDLLVASPKDAALKHMGFEKVHGEAGRVLATLKSFGLIEEVNGRIKLTQRGINIVVRVAGDAQRADALREAAISPEIYRQLLKQYRESIPSETTLKSDLIAVRKFNPNAVDGFIRDFKGTLEFAGLSDLSAVELDLEEEEPETAEQTSEPPTIARQPAMEPRQPKSGMPSLTPPAVGVSLLAQTLPISIPRNLRVDIQVRGDELKKEDLAKIKSQITRWLEGLDEAFE
jgi:DNA segregation ATPase FtsK/SpoIIIE-like protein